jgi:polysaccharide deacetylase 2 family uncharacterized protein YibQ
VVIPATPADGKSNGLDPRLSESSPTDPLPKIASDGARPADVYARPVKPIAGKPNAPKVAIVVGGLGISSSATADALAKLPGPITLAFAPYGNALGELTTRARADGHELLLQVPMEPFDYPDNDPGPQTLLTSLEPEQNIERLRWLMSRFQGYVGINNLMGARFTATEAVLAPVLREAAKRGLIYLDDGSSQRSVAPLIAGAANLPFAKADLAIDAVPTPGDVERAQPARDHRARARHRDRRRRRAAGRDRPHRQMGEERRRPRHPAHPDQRGGEAAGRQTTDGGRRTTENSGPMTEVAT